ncbi:MAG: ABC transporter permease subunit [Candidatus Lokiarchaeota archaeon]|nr:ABC transporter permease subunit [Candidatus Lokiarchaeota archaeon]
MKVIQTTLKEIRYSIKGIIILALLFGLFFLAFMAIYDPTLFEDMEALLASYPEAIVAMVGKYIALTTFGGFLNVYLFSMTWFYFGFYFIIKAAQDIPKEIEDKTVDIILSKPIKRWKFVIGKYVRHVITAFILVTFSSFGILIGVFAFPTIVPSEVYFNEIYTVFLWLFIFLVAIISTSLFFSTFLRPRRALTFSFAVIVFFYIVGIFWEAFPEAVQGMKFLSIFYYFETSNLLVNHVWDNVLLNILILTGYSACMVGLSVFIFNKRDIPV